MTRRARLSGEGGFGIPELLIAMLVLSVGIMAIVAGFSSGIIALDRASRASTAGTLADKQMEAYRALPFKQIALSGSPPITPDALYLDDVALDGDPQTGTTTLASGGNPFSGASTAYDGVFCNTTHVECEPIRLVTGPDGRSYRVDTYIVWYCPLPTLTPATPSASPACMNGADIVARPVKKITVVVRDGAPPHAKTYIRQTSTFDEAT